MSSMPDVAAVREALGELRDPESGRRLNSTGQVHHVEVTPERVRAVLGLVSHSRPIADEFAASARTFLAERFAVSPAAVTIEIAGHSRRPAALGTIGLRCRSVIAVGSGKGGVGKSSVAACLALTLKRFGCAVGLLDADVYGPSVPQLLGASGQPARAGDKIAPIDVDGMPVMSIGFLVPPDQAIIWRGPMLHSAVTQFLRDTDWGELDYLVIDMPPGTGDVALTLSQTIPLGGAVVVCTPQKVALLDAVKAIAMFHKVQIPVLGVVENMSTFICPDNGQRYDIFGHGGARRLADASGVPFLGEIPIHIPLRERGDGGTTVENLNDPHIAPYLDAVARALVRTLAERAAAAPAQAPLPVLQ